VLCAPTWQRMKVIDRVGTHARDVSICQADPTSLLGESQALATEFLFKFGRIDKINNIASVGQSIHV
jgi:hypothetical protein